MQKKSVGLRIKGKDRIMPYVKLGHLSTIKSLFERRVCVRAYMCSCGRCSSSISIWRSVT